MTRMRHTFRIGTRGSPLAVAQAVGALDQIHAWVPAVKWELVTLSSPGDRDRETDLRATDADFFTRDLDEAVLDGSLKAAIHSAKDVPEVVAAGLDWCWLPWRADPRDVLVFPAGRSLADYPDAPRIGVSSERREQYGRMRFPDARLLPIRGNIESRLAQLDAGAYDVLIMAGAALLRLGLDERIGEWIPLVDLPTPEGQGVLCLTFREGDPEMLRLRALFVVAASFVGAGAGHGMCTLAGAELLEHCQVCLHDALLDPGLLERVPVSARCIAVGKRAGGHAVLQEETTRRLVDEIRRGYRVVRLKGGDPGVFGRLAEELAALETLRLPYHVVPGVSSLSTATTGTGMLLTRRGASRGFCVLTPRAEGGGMWTCDAAGRATLPLVLFMAGHVIDQVGAMLLADGMPGDTPVAVVFDAGFDDEEIVETTLRELTEAFRESLAERSAPSICIVGPPARGRYGRNVGALGGRRVLLTCSAPLQGAAARTVRALGGVPLQRPLIRLAPVDGAAEAIGELSGYDWVVVTSPSAVRCLLAVMREARVDVRDLPSIIACGPGTARELHGAGLEPAAVPSDDYGARGLLACVGELLCPGQRVLRVRSDRAGPHLADALRRECGVEVVDVELYRNHMAHPGPPPACDAILFASRSAVASCLEQWGAHVLRDCMTVALGSPTAKALEEAGVVGSLVSPVASIEGALSALAAWCVNQEIEEMIR